MWPSSAFTVLNPFSTFKVLMNMLVSIHQGFGHRDRGGVVAGLCGAAVIAVLLLGPQTTRRTLAASLWPHRVNRIRLSSGFLLRPCSEGK